MGTDVDKPSYPKPPGRPRGKGKATQIQKRLMGVEAAAIAYVQMVHGEYRYPEGARRQYNEDGTPGVNGRELMRRAGYSPGSWDHCEEYLFSQDEFWQFVELYEVRRTDPMFRRDRESQLWSTIGNEALRNLYEQVMYYPHSLTIDQHIRLVKLILDAGVTMGKMGGEQESKTDNLLSSITDDDKRKKLLDGYKKNLEKELENLESLERAHEGANLKENE